MTDAPHDRPEAAGDELVRLRQRLDHVLNEYKAGRIEHGHTISVIIDKMQPYLEAHTRRREAALLSQDLSWDIRLDDRIVTIHFLPDHIKERMLGALTNKLG